MRNIRPDEIAQIIVNKLDITAAPGKVHKIIGIIQPYNIPGVVGLFKLAAWRIIESFGITGNEVTFDIRPVAHCLKQL